VDDPIVFLHLNALGTVLLYFGYDSFKTGITGDSHTAEEGVYTTYLTDSVPGAMLLFAGACIWLGSFQWL